MTSPRNTLGVRPLCVLLSVKKHGGCISRMGVIGERLLGLGLIERIDSAAEYVRITAAGTELLAREWSDRSNTFYNQHNWR